MVVFSPVAQQPSSEANAFHVAVLLLTESTSTKHVLDSRHKADDQLLFHQVWTISHEKLHDNGHISVA